MKIVYREFVDTCLGEAGIYKTGLNHGVDIVDPDKFDQDMVELGRRDEDFARHVKGFLRNVNPLVPGHYGTGGYDGPSRLWWEIPPTWSPTYRWVGKPDHVRRFGRG